MPVLEQGHAHAIVRRAKANRGRVKMYLRCEPRFNYGRSGHKTTLRKSDVFFTSEGADKTVLRLRSEVPLRIVDGAAVAEFTLAAEETAAFILEDVTAGEESPCEAADFVANSFKATLDFWRTWVAQSKYTGRWREMVNRSALTLKLLASQTHGSVVAAPTFGLPELLGGKRNWDYRYCWIRDSAFTVYALMRLGFKGEASAYMKWIEARCGELKPDGSLQVMYGFDGRHNLRERELKHFEGYRGASPVRIGNGAFDQLQLDIHGELIDSVYIFNKHGEPISDALWSNLVRLIDWVCNNWRKPDAGMWETRGRRKQFLTSRLMCWVAVDRGIRLAANRSFPAPLAHWTKVRDRIYRDVHDNFWDAKQQAFVRHKGSNLLDAGLLLMPLVKFVSPRDPRWLSTLDRIGKVLVQDSHVHRYASDRKIPDGVAGREGAFSMCSFWYAEFLARSGDVKMARLHFEKMLGYANHLGLYGEELGAQGEHLDNFPQAFTHLALISAAFNIDRGLGVS
jgi:GH15 family glucan-1,4-alpha-glucosidase